MSPDSVNVEAFLRGTLFGALPAPALARLAAVATVEAFGARRTLVAPGEPMQALRLVIEGGIAVSARNGLGQQVLMSIIGPGAWAAWLPCFVPTPLNTESVAQPGSVCIARPAGEVRACFDAHPGLYPLVMAAIDDRMRLLMTWSGHFPMLDPERRMAMLLDLLARDRRLQRPGDTLHVTRAQLATLLGCTRQSAAELLARLEARGLVATGYGSCRILDVEALRRFAALKDGAGAEGGPATARQRSRARAR